MAASEATRFLNTYQHEHATTRRVLHAFPEAQSAFKPHERSSSAFQLAWTFVIEERFILEAMKHEFSLGRGFPKPPQTWKEILDEFDSVAKEVVAKLQAPATSLDGTVTFFTAPKQTGEIPTESFMWFMLSDQIHHRGQLSVYVRMAGGRVPSIYGPSADEPWN